MSQGKAGMRPGELLMDVGGTFIKAGLAFGDNSMVPESFFNVPIDSSGSKETILSSLLEVLSKGAEASDSLGISIDGIGICFPGPFDYGKGIPLMKHKFTSIYGLDLKQEIQRSGIFNEDTPVKFMHDVSAMLAGEMSQGFGQGMNNVALVTLGTGLGFNFCKERQIQYSPMRSPAIVIYYLPYKDGILEDYASKRGFLRTYAEILAREGYGTSLRTGLTVADLGRMAGEGDSAALETFSTVAKTIADVISPILEEQKIECLLFGGQISKSFRFMEKALHTELDGKVSSLRTICRVKNIDNAAFYGLCSLLNGEIS